MIDDETILTNAEYELDFLHLVIKLFMESDDENFVPLNPDNIPINDVQDYLTKLFIKRIGKANLEDAIQFFTFTLLKSVMYFYLLTPKDESTLQRALAESLKFTRRDSDPKLVDEMLTRMKKGFDEQEKPQ